VLWPVALAPVWLGMTGLVYGGVALVLSLLFTLAAVRVWFDDGETSARRMFRFSLVYLFLLFAVMVIDRAPGLTALIGGLVGGGA